MNELNSQQLTQDFVYALAVPAKSGQSGICFVARQSGLYFSEDEGNNWQNAYAVLNLDAPLPTTCLALSPDFERDACLFAGVPGHVMRSEDGGKNWSAVALPYVSSLPTALAISPNFTKDGALLIATNEDGVLRSTDRGLSWASWNFGLLDFNVLSLAISPNFARDETAYAGTSSGLFCSHTGGKAWKELSLPVGYVPVLSLAISPDFERDGTLLVGTEADGLFLSPDRGQSWRHLGAEMIQGMVSQIVLAPGYPARNEIFVAHENTILRSDDAGETWSVLFEDEIACLAAFQDENGGVSLLVGLVNGLIKRI